MHVCTYTHVYIHIYFTACGPPKHQRVMSGRNHDASKHCFSAIYIPALTCTFTDMVYIPEYRLHELQSKTKTK